MTGFNMKNVLQFLSFFIFISLELSTVSAVTYLSSASNGAAWTSTTTLDAYQNTSNNFVGRSSSATYNPTGGDTLKGFFMFRAGFSSWSSGTLTWDGLGIIDNVFSIPTGGTLSLTSDLHLGPKATIASGGGFTINGTASYPGAKIFLDGDAVILSRTCNVNTGTYLTIDGQGHAFTVANGGSLNYGNVTLSNMDILLTNTAGYLYNSLSIGSSYIFENLTIRAGGDGTRVRIARAQSNDPLITINGDVRLEGFGQRIIVNAAITINSNSKLYVGPGVILTNFISIAMTDQTSVLHLDGCQFYTGNDSDGASLSSGLTLTKGTLILENNVKIFNRNYGNTGAANANMSKALILGDGSSTNDVNVVVRAGAYVAVDGCVDYRAS